MTAMITPNQQKQLRRLAEDAIDSGFLDTLSREAAQRVITGGGEFQQRLRKLIKELGKGKYADEEVESSYTYTLNLKPSWDEELEYQVDNLRSYGFPIKPFARVTYEVPIGFDGLFVLMRPHEIASHINDEAKQFSYATDFVLERLSELGHWKKVVNYLKGRTEPRYLQLTKRSSEMHAELRRQYEDFTLVLPGQLGRRHAGRSMRRAREVCIGDEFVGDNVLGGQVLLAHPERLQRFEDLFMDCPGAEFSPDGDSRFSCAPFFGAVVDGWLDAGASRVVDASDHSGACSFSLPQPEF